MSFADWLIVLIPTALVMGIGIYSRRLISGVSDFIVAGRVCNRYVLTTGDMANALALVALIAYVEVHYQTGVALNFWRNITLPIFVILSLSGYCLYRFRETRAMSIGQFLEMRYSRSLRIFSCFVRSIAEIMANIIMPALAARFFIFYLGLPQKLNLFGWQCPTFVLVVLVTLVLAITLICVAGEISIRITDTLQCLICLPLILVFIIFLLCKFSWSNEIVAVMEDRAAGESFLNPYDISKLQDFNFFMVFVLIFNAFLHRASGVTGSSNAAKSAHEGKMASVLSSWRSNFGTILYVVVAVAIITIMNHRNYAEDARSIRLAITNQISEELAASPEQGAKLRAEMAKIPPQRHQIGKDAPLSQKVNLDTPYFQKAQDVFGKDGRGSHQTQQFKTLFRQLMMPAAMRHMLPPGLAGLFCLMIILFMVSSDDSRIYSASSTLVQDCIVPFFSAGKLSLELHISLIRWVSIGVGAVFLVGSYFMSQLDYINLFVTIMYGMWLGGCGPMIVFGFYSRFGTTAGAWTSLLGGMLINFIGLFLQRTWAIFTYPLLEQWGWVEPIGSFLSAVSRPFNPYIVWEMNRLKFPINSYEIGFIAMVTSIILYVGVSLLTCRKPFNLERMLHRGKYATEGEKKIKSPWTLKSVWGKLIGITPEYSFWDRVIAWCVFSYSVLLQFVLFFVVVVVWNIFSPWPKAWWGNYFLIVSLLVPGIAIAVTTVWFGIGGIWGLFDMFRCLRQRVANPLDNGMVEGNMSLDDKAQLEAIDRKSEGK